MRNRVLFGLLAFLSISCSKPDSVFKLLNAKDTGISFSNTIIENDSINILTYDYTYNGGGVAIADFNNDGLKDVFFSANMVGNKLYLNKGELRFEDISETSNISGEGRWCTAAIAVDVNADGWMDIYVPTSSTTNSLSTVRENLLYVNQGKSGNPTFIEMGKEYGVNSDGYTEGSAFFDYDNDGDLDLYVLNNVIDHSPNTYRKKVVDGTYPNTDQLYRCDWDETLGHPVFTDVSKEAGIMIEGFGLGVNISDINRDGWKDIYVTNDYAADDILYINNKNGTFSDQAKSYFKHTSNSAMGNDIADINNDGLADVIALDMMPRDNLRKKMFVSATNIDGFRNSDQFGYTYQYMRNSLQLNSGNGASFQEIGLLAGVAETDWSWTPSIVDFDNDGYRDLLITNGFPKDVTDKDFVLYRAEASQIANKELLLSQIPAVKISNYGFKNTDGIHFEDVTEQWGLSLPSFSSGASYGDLDNDGDLDYIVNNTNDVAFVYENKTINKEKKNVNFLNIKFKGSNKNKSGIGAILIGTIEKENDFYFELNPYRGYKSSVEADCHIGLGTLTHLKELKVIWPNGYVQKLNNIEANQFIEVSISDAKEKFDWEKDLNTSRLFEEIRDFNFVHHEFPFSDFNIQNSMPFSVANMGPGMAVGDVNGDDLDDVFFGGAKFKRGTFMLQNKDGSFTEKYLLPDIDTTQKRSEDTGVLLFDADKDGDNDLYIVSGGNEDFPNATSFADRFYENLGNGKFRNLDSALPQNTISGAGVRAADYDGDGDLDLFIAGRNSPMEYPKATSSIILRNDSNASGFKFTDVSKNIAPGLSDFGMVCDALWTDYDNDKDKDLMLVGDFNSITFFENKGGKFEKVLNSGLEGFSGIWNSISSGDFDHDGDLDYVVGNVGENALFKGTKKYPAVLLSGDFDNNERYDVLPFLHFPDGKGSLVLAPYNGKEDISKQFNPFRTRFTTFKEFSQATFDNLLTKEEMAKAIKHELNHNGSSYIENLGNGKFALKNLPIEAQFAPINGLLTDDFNQDGNLDVLIVGNNFGNEILVGRMDALNGLLLLGNGKGGFTSSRNNGIDVTGDAKSLVQLYNSNGESLIIASQNKGKAIMYKSAMKGTIYALKDNESWVKYTYKGKQIFIEKYFGSSFLSQSSRKILIPLGAENIEIG
jgi:enediyne biosynthesis protein E4